jgi:hypothetical protein
VPSVGTHALRHVRTFRPGGILVVGGADRIGAARYRARKRGEPVAKRKPGPKAQKITELRTEISGLQTRISEWRV